MEADWASREPVDVHHRTRASDPNPQVEFYELTPDLAIRSSIS